MRKPVEILLAWPIIPLVCCLFIGIVVSSGYFFYDDFYFLHWVRHAKPSPLQWFAVWETGLWRPFFIAYVWLLHAGWNALPKARPVFGGVLVAYIAANLLLYPFGTAINRYRQHDALHARLVSELRALSPPPAKVVEIKGLEEMLAHLPPYSFVYLYSLAVEHDPPEQVVVREEVEHKKPDLVLVWRGEKIGWEKK